MASNESASDIASPLSVVFTYWKEFDLETVRGKLDEVALKVAENQEESMQSRRKLAESTREFKRSAPETVTKSVGALLKQYQEEVDRLSKRAKQGESAFLDLYQKLYEAPDPAPALSVAFENASRAADLEAQCKKMGQELADYKAESTHIKNQDLTLRKLEDKVRTLEAQLEEKDRELLEVQERAVAEADAARLAQMQDREHELTVMLREAQNNIANLQKLHQATQNQLFAIQSQSEEDRVGQQTELELATAELERAHERLVALENEKQKLVQQATHKASDQTKVVTSNIEENLRHELSSQREVASMLRSEVASLRREIEETNSVWEARVEGLKSTVLAQEQHAQALEQELSMRPTISQVEELKQQLRVYQAIGYNAIENEDIHKAEDGASSVPPGGVSSSLEGLLLQKNRHLEHDLTMAKLKNVDLKQELDTVFAQVADLEQQLQEKEALVNRLEEDLVSGGTGGVGANKRSTKQLSGLLSSGGGNDEEEGEQPMLRVICSQRDRFRQRVHELEEELNKVRTELQTVKAAAAAAHADNIALVERLKYVHGFKAQRKHGDVESGSDAEKKYEGIYKEGINPFKEFQGQERERQKKQLNFVDKAMYLVGQLIFGNKTARLVTFAYLLALHVLVFATLMRMTHHSSSQLYEHQQGVLEGEARHDATAAMQHELPFVTSKLATIAANATH